MADEKKINIKDKLSKFKIDSIDVKANEIKHPKSRSNYASGTFDVSYKVGQFEILIKINVTAEQIESTAEQTFHTSIKDDKVCIKSCLFAETDKCDFSFGLDKKNKLCSMLHDMIINDNHTQFSDDDFRTIFYFTLNSIYDYYWKPSEKLPMICYNLIQMLIE